MSEPENDTRPLIERLVTSEPASNRLWLGDRCVARSVARDQVPDQVERLSRNIAIAAERAAVSTADRLAVALLVGDTGAARVLMDVLRDEHNWHDDDPAFVGRAEMVRLLRGAEFAATFWDQAACCSGCGNTETQGHKDGCRLALAIGAKASP